LFSERSGWMPVSKKLPKEGVEVLVIVADEDGSALKDIGAISAQGAWETYKHEGQVSHWAPIPKFRQ
jgi:hypothetical protein